MIVLGPPKIYAKSKIYPKLQIMIPRYLDILGLYLLALYTERDLNVILGLIP